MSEKAKNRLVFWVRFLIYLVVGMVIPVVFLIWRFKLFQKIDSVSIGGWGVIAILIIFVFLVKLLKSVKKGLPFSFWTQLITGYLKTVIPLLAAVLVINCLKDSISELIQFLVVFITCQVIAVPANPFPQWAHDNKIAEDENKLRKTFESLGILKPKQ